LERLEVGRGRDARATAHGFQLVVHPPEITTAAVHFGVMHRGCTGESLIGAGQAESVRAAMKAAVDMAGRFARSLAKTG
jgi:hypothetical protein